MRLFVGIFPPAVVQRDVHATLITAPRGPRLRWTAPEKLHLTLAFLGECGADRLREIHAAVDAAARARAPFEIELHGLGAFPDLDRPRVLYVDVGAGVEDLRVVHAALREALPPGLRPESPPWRPHLTLARPPRAVPAHEIEELRTELQAWRWRFAARELALVESVPEPTGARYVARHVTGLVGSSGDA